MDNQPQKTNKIYDWCKRHVVLVVSVLSVAFYIFTYLNNQRIAQKYEAETRELRQMILHSNETDFALRLSGLKQTATITENAMNVQYQQNLERIANAKQSRCTLPPNLENAIALPNYVPIATIYLQEKQKLEKENY